MRRSGQKKFLAEPRPTPLEKPLPIWKNVFTEKPPK
jgi:hypothetical protein